jgi:hypothetical protein
MRRSWVGLAVAALGVIGAIVPASGAVAGGQKLNDPVGDVGGLKDPRADIVDFSLSHDGTTIVMSATTAAFEDPATGPNWKAYDTYVNFTLYYYGAQDDDITSFSLWNDGGSAAVWSDSACAATPSWNAAARSYTVAVAASCLGNPSRVEMYADAQYDTAAGDSWDDTDFTGYVYAPAPAGYWMVTASGSVYGFGGVSNLGGARPSLGFDMVDLAPTASGHGYYLLDDGGTVFEFGDAEYRGDAYDSIPYDELATAISVTPTGGGYWVFTDRGRVLAFGDAKHFGDMTGVRLNGPVLDAIATPTGNGYYMVASDGGIFAFGDAKFYGSMGGVRLNAPVQSLVPDPDGVGYWLVASDGGVFAFSAGFRGSMGGVRLNRPVTGMVPNGNGYLMVGEDGGIFNFSDQPFFGSLGATPPSSPVVSVASSR